MKRNNNKNFTLHKKENIVFKIIKKRKIWTDKVNLIKIILLGR